MQDMNDWIKQVESKLTLGDRVIHFDPHPDTGQLFIHYYNLPKAIYQAKEGGGAERENNRIMLTVLFFGKHGWYEKPVAEGSLRVGQAVNALSRDYKLRGKTCAPGKMVDYVASYLNKVASSVPPKYTHSKPPIS